MEKRIQLIGETLRPTTETAIDLPAKIRKENMRRMFLTSVFSVAFFLGVAVFCATGYIQLYNENTLKVVLLASELYALCVSIFCLWRVPHFSEEPAAVPMGLWMGYLVIYLGFPLLAESNTGVWTSFLVGLSLFSFIPLFSMKQYMSIWAVQFLWGCYIVVARQFTMEQALFVLVIEALCLCISYLRYDNYVVKLRDKEDIQMARQIAQTDPLTGLLNGRGMDHKLEEIWPLCKRSSVPVGVLMIDIDNFKLYNDTFGHLEGDKCLTQVAHKIHQCGRRKTDFAARVGGEEFLVFLYDIPASEVVKKAEELQEAILELEIPHSEKNFHPFVSVSVGIAAKYPERETEFTELREEADQYLYTAKHQGRACVCGVDVVDTSKNTEEKIEQEANQCTA